MTDGNTFFDGLSQAEGAFCEDIVKKLSGRSWADRLLRGINEAGGIRQENKSLLFELRFANALHESGVEPDYEIPGVHGSTLDFGFTSRDVLWSVELMRLQETTAAQGATRSRTDADGVEWVERRLSSTADDIRQSEEGETLKAVQRICQKCEKDGRPHKFPRPRDRFHVILVDFRTFLNGGDEADRIHVALGGDHLCNEVFRRHFDGRLITGVFNDQTTLSGATEARERVHFIGFVNERTYATGSFAEST